MCPESLQQATNHLCSQGMQTRFEKLQRRKHFERILRVSSQCASSLARIVQGGVVKGVC